YLRCVPNTVVLAPSDEDECRQMLFTAFQHDGPSAVRYPRGAGVGAVVRKDLNAIPIGRGEVRRRGRRLAILSFGTVLADCIAAGDALDATVVNMRFVKPIDIELLVELARSHEAFVSVEEHVVGGGAGSAASEALASAGVVRPILHLGLPDRFVDHGDQRTLLVSLGLDAAGIEASIRARFGELCS